MEKKNVVSFRRGGEVTTLDLSFAGAGETTVVMVESITYKYINGKKKDMENLNPPLNLVFSTRAASQEITVPSDATKKTFTIHSYRDTVVNGKVSKSDIIDFTTSITYDPPISSSNAWVFTKKTSNDAVSYNLEVDISANSGSSSRAATITLTQATTGKVITITITQKAVDIPMYVEIWGRYDKNSLTTYKDLPYILNYNGQYVTSGTLPASQDEYLLIPVTKVPWSDNGSYTEPTAIFELYLKVVNWYLILISILI